MKDAEQILKLIREQSYNLQRSDADILKELCAVIRLMDRRIAKLEGEL